MIAYLTGEITASTAFLGILFAFAATCFFITKFRGAGIIFILVFAVSALIFAEITLETGIYLLLIVAEMLT